MQMVNFVLILFLIVCTIAVEKTKDLLSAVLIFSSYSFIIAVLWLLLKAPDVALAEASIGTGITTILFIAVIAKIGDGNGE